MLLHCLKGGRGRERRRKREGEGCLHSSRHARFVSVCRSLSLSLSIGPEEGIDESEASWHCESLMESIYDTCAIHISISISLNQHMYSFKMTILGEF